MGDNIIAVAAVMVSTDYSMRLRNVSAVHWPALLHLLCFLNRN